MTEVWNGLTIDVDALADHGQAEVISYDGEDLQRWVAYFKAGIAEVQARIGTTAAALRGSSSTNATLDAGAKSLTIETGKGFAAGDWVLAYETANPTTKWMAGQVTSYTTGTGVLAFTVASPNFVGSGSVTAWTVGISAQPGPQGSAGADAKVPGFDEIALERAVRLASMAAMRL